METHTRIPVLHLISSFELGGAEKLLLDLVAENSRRPELEFTVVVMNGLVDEGLKEKLLATGCEVHFLNRPPSHVHPKYLRTLLSIIRSRKIKVIHSHNTGSKMWAALCKLLLPYLKLVFTIHDTNIVRRLNGTHLFLHRHVIDRNVAISGAVRQECEDHGIRNAVMIYNGIHVEPFRRFAKQDYGVTGGLKLVNVARITHKKKGQDVLIRAVKRCVDDGLDVSCTFIGGVYEYDPGSMQELERLADGLGVRDRIRFLGSRPNVHELLGQYDVFVLPSRYEGLGLVVLEAMASGVPVIASDIDGPAELVRHEENGLLFRSEDDRELAERIRRMADRGLAERLAQAASAGVGRFDIRTMLERYAAVYREIAGRR